MTEDYERRTCTTCKGTGSHYDATNVDKVATGGKGTSTCFRCDGAGYTLHITKDGLRRERERWSA